VRRARELRCERPDQRGAAASERRAVARQERVPGRELPAASPPEQCALLGERPLVASEIAEQRRTQVDQAAVQEAPPRGRRAGHQLAVRRGPGERRQHRQVFRERGSLVVERAVSLPRAETHRQPARRFPADLGGDEEALGAAPDAGRELRGTKAPRGRRQVDGFEQAGLAGAIAAEQEDAAGRGRPIERREVPKIAEAEALERGGPRQMRMGMMMQT